jgi:hypothetical protein
MLNRGALVLCVALVCSGCSVLFPEFSGSSPDAATDAALIGDALATHQISGQLCVLTDLRDYRSCTSSGTLALKITVEETRDSVVANANGTFVLALSQPLTSATLTAVDSGGQFATAVIPLKAVNGALSNIAVPIVSLTDASTLAYSLGFSFDATLGSVLGYAIAPSGVPVPSVTAPSQQNVLGPYYDGAAQNELLLGGATGARGMVALFELTPPSLSLSLTTPSSASVTGDTFTLPIRAGTITISTLVLPSR